MSIISQLGDNFERLPDILVQYDEYLVDAEKHIAIKGKTLEAANVEHASWMSYYDQRKVELHALLKYMEREQERVRGKLWDGYTHKTDISYNTRDKENLINRETAYLVKNEMYLEVLELHGKFAALVEAFKSRGFALNNIVKLRTSAIENDVI